MKTVKTFSNLAEAGFATSLLEAAGTDGWDTYRHDRFVHSEQDIHFDGKIDAWWFYTPTGILIRSELDTNRDGRIDHGSSMRMASPPPHASMWTTTASRTFSIVTKTTCSRKRTSAPAILKLCFADGILARHSGRRMDG